MKRWQPIHTNWKGFSLIELVIALAIIGIMAAAATPLIMNALNKSRSARTIVEMEEVRNAVVSLAGDSSLLTYDPTTTIPGTSIKGGFQDCDSRLGVPTVLATVKLPLPAFPSRPSDEYYEDLDLHLYYNCRPPKTYTLITLGARWSGPYMQQNRTDPWGTGYHLYPNQLNDAEPGLIISAGSDEYIDSDASGPQGDDTFLKVVVR